ncbi:MAG: STAS domain-containing protein [Gammaproteobacteria bacterium]|nr:STAS domain-containing protein [Gammaproteobacteria bacterium]
MTTGKQKKVASKGNPKKKIGVAKRAGSKKPSLKTASSKEKKALLTLACGDDFSIRNAQEFQQQLTQALANKQSVEVDASQVTQTDTAGLQLLYAFSKKASENGLDFKWKNISDDFRNTAELLGMSDCLNLPSN